MKSIGILVAVAAVIGVCIPKPADAIIPITNTGYVDFENEAGLVMTPVPGTATFYRQSNPLLALNKRVLDESFVDITDTTVAIGSTVYYEIAVTYPQIVDTALACGDDSQAQNIVITDPLPAQFTPIVDSGEFSEDNGGAWTGFTSATLDDDGEIVGQDLTVRLPNPMAEGDGDAACAGVGTTRLIRVRGIVNAL